ncbi:hypothetical protein A8B78_04725 [Jannaschia sp. EhC01]|nr:hypothetical protein A8B78_04725 [Jannaschia sp. EhC01]
MASLTQKTAFDGLLPITTGTTTLEEVTHDAITWVAPAKGKAAAVSKALEKQIQAPFPKPNRISGPAVWTGPGQAMVLGQPLRPLSGAALSDQTSAWACCAIDGPDARDVLSRLVPIDLRADVFKVGHAARTVLGHMNCVLMRPAQDRYEVMVFRSMAATATHELTRAMAMVAARQSLV